MYDFCTIYIRFTNLNKIVILKEILESNMVSTST